MFVQLLWVFDAVFFFQLTPFQASLSLHKLRLLHRLMPFQA